MFDPIHVSFAPLDHARSRQDEILRQVGILPAPRAGYEPAAHGAVRRGFRRACVLRSLVRRIAPRFLSRIVL